MESLMHVYANLKSHLKSCGKYNYRHNSRSVQSKGSSPLKSNQFVQVKPHEQLWSASKSVFGYMEQSFDWLQKFANRLSPFFFLKDNLI